MKKLTFILLLFTVFLSGCEKEKTMQEITINYKNVNHPSVSNDHLYFTAANNILNSESVNKLIEYNLNSGTENVLYESEFNPASMQHTQANEKWLVWVDSTLDGLNAKILSMDLETKTIKELDKTHSEHLTILAPILYNQYVGWVSFINDETIQVKLHNLETNETKTIGTLHSFGLYNAFISIKDNTVMWTDTKDGVGSYHLYDLKKKKETIIPAPETFPAYAKYSDKKIFAVNFPDFNIWDAQNFGYYDLEKEKYFKINTDTPYINSFDVYENQLVIIDANQKVNQYTIDDNQLIDNETKATIENQFQANFDQEGNLRFLSEEINKTVINIFPF